MASKMVSLVVLIGLALPAFAGQACTPHDCTIDHSTHLYVCSVWGAGFCGCFISNGGTMCTIWGNCGVNHVCTIGGAAPNVANPITAYPWTSDETAIYNAVQKSRLAGTKQIVENVRVNLLTGKSPIIHNSGVHVLVDGRDYSARVKLSGGAVIIHFYAPDSKQVAETLTFGKTQWTHKGDGLPDSTGKVDKPITMKSACGKIAEGDHKLGEGF